MVPAVAELQGDGVRVQRRWEFIAHIWRPHVMNLAARFFFLLPEFSAATIFDRKSCKL